MRLDQPTIFCLSSTIVNPSREEREERRESGREEDWTNRLWILMGSIGVHEYSYRGHLLGEIRNPPCTRRPFFFNVHRDTCCYSRIVYARFTVIDSRQHGNFEIRRNLGIEDAQKIDCSRNIMILWLEKYYMDFGFILYRNLRHKKNTHTITGQTSFIKFKIKDIMSEKCTHFSIT